MNLSFLSDTSASLDSAPSSSRLSFSSSPSAHPRPTHFSSRITITPAPTHLPKRGSSSKAPVYAPSHVPDAQSLLVTYLTSPNPSENVFVAGKTELERLMKLHHLKTESEPALSLTSMRDAFLSHLLSGSCVSVCPSSHTNLHTSSKDRCECSAFVSEFNNQKSMSFAVLSVLLSASESTLPDSHVEQLGLSLGMSHAVAVSRVDCYSFLGIKRRDIIADHSSKNPAVATRP